MIGPEGQSYPGQIYKGYSSWGLYYQIRTRRPSSRDELSQLAMGKLLQVVIDRVGSGVVVRLDWA